MTRFDYSHDSGIFINKCAACGGAWLESGQLELIAQYRTGTRAERELANALADEMRISSRWRFARQLLRSRLLSGLVAIAYLLVVVFVREDLGSVLRMSLFLLLPLMCIWFPDTMGNLTSHSMGVGRPAITRTTPGDFVAIAGWLLLFCPVVVALITAC